MSIPSSYQLEKFLTTEVGNNAFDYQERASSHPEPYLRIAPLKEFPDANSALQKLQRANSPAFEIIEEGKLKSFPGLENFLVFPNPENQTPIYVFDNHNHAFFFWHWWTNHQNLPIPFTLLHVDQHKDTRIPISMLAPADAHDQKKLQEYTSEILNVGNFIPPAIKTGLLSEIQIIDSTNTLQALVENPLPEHYILDLDLDFFAPDLDYLNNSLKISAIKKALTKASITTIATSPFFIDDQIAFDFLRKIFQ